MEKIIFQVVLVGDKKFFQISNRKKTLFLDKLLAVWFEGYRCSECKILRSNELYDEGFIVYHGTHAASEFFSGWRKITTEDLTDEVCAEQLEVGDVLEIENNSEHERRYYANIGDFIKGVVAFKQIGDSLDEAFAAHGGTLSREEFVEALIKSSSGVSWRDRMKKIIIVEL
jgi:hypothetical protein